YESASAVHSSTLHSFPTRRSSDLKKRKACLPDHRGDRMQSRWGAGKPLHFLSQISSFRFEITRLGEEPWIVESLAHRVPKQVSRSEEHTSELQSRVDLVCRLLLEK